MGPTGHFAANPLRGWQVDRAAIRHVGHDLQRPECVLAERDGTLWAADVRGGVMRDFKAGVLTPGTTAAPYGTPAP